MKGIKANGRKQTLQNFLGFMNLKVSCLQRALKLQTSEDNLNFSPKLILSDVASYFFLHR